jgi:hypothetical protein
MRYFNAFAAGGFMSRKDAVLIASRTLSLFFTVWALAGLSYLPEFLNSYRYYATTSSGSVAYVQNMQHYYLLGTCFLIVRIVGYSLLARWLYKAGPEVEGLLLPKESCEAAEK